MDELHSAKQAPHLASSEDIRRLFRHLDDHAVAAILALKPTIAQLEEAAARIAGEGEIFADVRPARGAVEDIVDLVCAEEEEEDEPR